jgi:predicted nucleic acid-binding protein
VDFLVAALAEINGAILLHYDRHFDVIRRVTKQPMQWLARRGSLER